jgi:hypothetical protein
MFEVVYDTPIARQPHHHVILGYIRYVDRTKINGADCVTCET